MILDVEFQQELALLEVELSQSEQQIGISFDEADQFDVDFGEIHHLVDDEIPVYEGSYEVTPALQSQTLETAGLLMADDTEIKPIPIYVVSNNSGGTTVTIGG